MASLSLLLAAYILGGITFLPLCLGLVLCHAYITFPTRKLSVDGNGLDTDSDAVFDGDTTPPQTPVKPDQRASRSHVPDVAASYFAVCREYVPGGINGKPPERTTPAGAVVGAESPSVYQNMYRSIFDRNAKTTPSTDHGKKARNVFYVVLRHGHLMLYDDSDQLEVRHVIALANYDVDVYGGGNVIPEGELWIKRNCIRLKQRVKAIELEAPSKPFYMFSDNCSDKEDFYHAILQNSDHCIDPERTLPTPLKIETSDLISLVQQLHASEENMHTRWLNALVGRLFLALYKTPEIERFIRTKVEKKIARVAKPAFIKSVSIQRIDMGTLPPFVTNPKLKELTMEGDLIIEADVSYKGNFRLDISAVARIELGTRFKAREVTLVLASILKKLDGRLLMRIKPPPSNRLWITFETPPKMEMSLEPIISTRQITYGVILRAIESRIREVVNETLVYPNWDDIPFSDSLSQELRGGLWTRTGEAQSPSSPITISQTQPIEPESDTATLVSDSASVTSIETASKVPSARRSDGSIKRRTIRTSLELSNESIATTSATNLLLNTKPQAMRSRSFSSVASPIVDVDPAISVLDERDSKSDAISAIKTTIARTSSGQHLHSEAMQDVSANTTPLQPAFQFPGPDTELRIDDKGNLSTTNPEGLEQDLRNPGLADDLLLTPERAEPSQSTSPIYPLKFGGRRPTLNQSLNTATAAAKKWLNSRPAQNGQSSIDLSLSPKPSTISRDSDSSGASVVEGAAHHLGPIGRGQPLPPPGTPLPPPPKPEKKAWSVPSPAAFANLTRRKPVAKTPILSTFDETQDRKNTSTERLEPSSNEQRKTQRRMTLGMEAAASLSPGLTQETPPPLPKRRQRLSAPTAADRPSGPIDHEILVVAAPQTSTPSSPAVPDFQIGGQEMGVIRADEPAGKGVGVVDGLAGIGIDSLDRKKALGKSL